MDEQQQLMKRLQAADFALLEAVLYLDTHPCDKVALDYYDKYQQMHNELQEEYTSRYGALSSFNVKTGDCFSWVNDPWPWEMED